jgi:hypothetical protein
MSRHIAASLAAALGAGLTTSCLFAAFEEALGELFRTLSSWQLAEAMMGADPWAPDGESVVVTLLNGMEPVLVRIPLDGAPARRLATGAAPVWSPDGTRLACSIFDPPLTGLCVLDAEQPVIPPLAIGPFAPSAWLVRHGFEVICTDNRFQRTNNTACIDYIYATNMNFS